MLKLYQTNKKDKFLLYGEGVIPENMKCELLDENPVLLDYVNISILDIHDLINRVIPIPNKHRDNDSKLFEAGINSYRDLVKEHLCNITNTSLLSKSLRDLVEEKYNKIYILENDYQIGDLIEIIKLSTNTEGCNYTDFNHPNNINKGYTKEGILLIKPILGGCIKLNTHFQTSTIQKIEGDKIYTRNSIYQIKVLQKASLGVELKEILTNYKKGIKI